MASAGEIKVNIKTTKGAKDSVMVAATATVLQLKQAIAGKLENSPVESQRLIYKGRVMKDDKTCADYSLENDHTVIVVTKNPKKKAVAPSTTNTQPAAPASNSESIPSSAQARGSEQPSAANPNAANPFAAFMGGNMGGNAAPPNMGGMGDMGGMMGGMGGMMQNPEMMQQMLNNPMVQNMMQQMAQNPDMLNQMLQNNPMLQNMAQQNPQIQTMLQNPEMLQQMFNPQMIQAAMNMQNAMQQMRTAQQNANPNPASGTGSEQNSGTGDANPSAANPNAANPNAANPNAANPNAANPNANPFAAFGGMPFMNMGGMMGGMGNNNMGAPAPDQNQRTAAATNYQSQISQLNDMGFTDADANLDALIMTGGNVQAAINRLLGGGN